MTIGDMLSAIILLFGLSFCYLYFLIFSVSCLHSAIMLDAINRRQWCNKKEEKFALNF